VTELKIEQQPLGDRNDAFVVAPQGPIRARAAEQFREYVDRLLNGEGATGLVIDMTGVEYIDSSTAGYLLNVHDRLRTRGGVLALAELTPGVRVVIDSIGLTTFFTVCETVEEAALEVG